MTTVNARDVMRLPNVGLSSSTSAVAVKVGVASWSRVTPALTVNTPVLGSMSKYDATDAVEAATAGTMR